MVPIAHRRLRHLRDQRLRIAQQQACCTGPARRNSSLSILPGSAIGVAGALNDGAARGRLAAHEQRDTDDALVADDRRSRPTRHPPSHTAGRRWRSSGSRRAATRLPDSYRTCAERHRHYRDAFADARQFVRGQGGEQLISAAVRRGRARSDSVPARSYAALPLCTLPNRDAPCGFHAALGGAGYANAQTAGPPYGIWLRTVHAGGCQAPTLDESRGGRP